MATHTITLAAPSVDIKNKLCKCRACDNCCCCARMFRALRDAFELGECPEFTVIATADEGCLSFDGEELRFVYTGSGELCSNLHDAYPEFTAVGNLACGDAYTLTLRCSYVDDNGDPALNGTPKMFMTYSMPCADPPTGDVETTIDCSTEVPTFTFNLVLVAGEDCECCQPVDDSVTGCEECPDGAPMQYRISGLTGITNGTCSDCNHAVLSADVLMTYMSGCSWAGEETNFCGGGLGWTLAFTTGSTWSLSFNGGVAALYQTSSFNCLQPTIFSLVATGAECENWPATLTVSPA